ncbi:MAG TPA: hypothetical protein VF516_35545 [Kofleriaceae bacterium]
MTHQPVAWKMVTAPDLKSVDLMIKGAYSVAVVCMINPTTVLVWQAFHTVDDDTSSTVKEPTLQTPCNAAPTQRTVHGTTVQDASVHLGNADASATGGTPFTVQVADGTYDLVATTKETDPATHKTLIQRNVMVSGDTTLPGTIDVSTGVAQVALGVVLSSPPNPAKSTETVAATVDVTTKNNKGSATVSSADYNLTNKTIKIFALPNSALMSGDTQTATFTGTNNIKDTSITTSRSITRPFSIGDAVATGMTSFALPAAIANPDWGMDKSRLSVALPTLPALDDLTVKTSGKTADGQTTVQYEIDITASYFQRTALARPVFDTDIPGFQPSWKIDFVHQAYSRQITSERDVFSKGAFVDHEESSFFEDVTP